jgi:integrase/recombinase XerD
MPKRIRPLTELEQAMQNYLAARGAQQFSSSAIASTRLALRRFARWARTRGVRTVRQVTRRVVEQYQQALFHYRKKDGCPLKSITQHHLLVDLRGFCRWLARNHLLPSDPSDLIELPRLPERLPQNPLSLRQADHVLALADLATPLGLRDRTIMELLLSTGMRRMEILALHLRDLSLEASTIWIQKGKGGRSRLIPLGRRARFWLEKYLLRSRPKLLKDNSSDTLFLTVRGKPMALHSLTLLLASYCRRAGVATPGAVHIFRHTFATFMLEGGADIRYIQEMLGHARLDTTQLYTRVSIKHLIEVHRRSHPVAELPPDAPLS